MRPREYDESEVLERALGVFWRHGYEGSSIADLVAATGVSRQSLYNAFTDKDGLFRAALDHYVGRVKQSLAPLERPEAGLAELRAYLEGVLALHREQHVGACLLVKTAFGPEATHPDVRRSVEAGADAVRRRFAQVIAAAEKRGELKGDIAPEACAALLYTVFNGLSALTHTGGNRAHVAAILTHTFESIGGGLLKARSRPSPKRGRKAGGTA